VGRLVGFSGREVMRIAEGEGWVHVRTRGDHYVFRKDGAPGNVAIPDHRTIAEGTLRAILKSMRMTPETFLQRARK
jgi:predicted RNA binding protein YcfA (HicA-like mRNA interferase family)